MMLNPALILVGGFMAQEGDLLLQSMRKTFVKLDMLRSAHLDQKSRTEIYVDSIRRGIVFWVLLVWFSIWLCLKRMHGKMLSIPAGKGRELTCLLANCTSKLDV